MVLIFVFWNIHSKPVILLVLFLDLEKNNVHQFLLSFFKMNDTVILKITFCSILVVIKPEFSIQIL